MPDPGSRDTRGHHVRSSPHLFDGNFWENPYHRPPLRVPILCLPGVSTLRYRQLAVHPHALVPRRLAEERCVVHRSILPIGTSCTQSMEEERTPRLSLLRERGRRNDYAGVSESKTIVASTLCVRQDKGLRIRQRVPSTCTTTSHSPPFPDMF